MTLPFHSMGSILALGEETAYGTAVSTGNVLGVTGCTLDVADEPVTLDYLGHVPTSLYPGRRETASVATDVGGDIEGYVSYDNPGFGLLLKAALGANATTGSGPYTHTMTQSMLGVLKGLTARHIIGRSLDASVTDKQRLYAGLCVSSFELMGKAREPLRYKATLIGQTGGVLVAMTGTPSLTPGEEALAHHVPTIVWNSLTLPTRDFSIKIDNKLQRRNLVGSKTTDVPAPSDFADVEVSATIEMVDDSLMDALVAQTSANMTIEATGTSPNVMTFTGYNAQLRTLTTPINKMGVTTFSAVWRLRQDASNYPLKCVLVNGNSALYS